VQEVLSEVQWQRLLKDAGENGSAIVTEFTAVWCPPCKMIAPILEEEAGKHPEIKFYKIDIDNEAVYSVVQDHNVSSVPTFVSYRGRQQLGAFAGADRDALLRMVSDLTGK
jgi:thioredoxin 1